MCTSAGKFSALRTFRVLRTLKAISVIPGKDQRVLPIFSLFQRHAMSNSSPVLVFSFLVTSCDGSQDPKVWLFFSL